MITRIKPLKFRIGKYVLNSAELWQYRFEVAQGIKPPTRVFTYDRSKSAMIKPDGSLSKHIGDLDNITNIKFDLVDLVRLSK